MDEMKKTAETLRELGSDWKENLATFDNAVSGSEDTFLSLKRLCKENNKGALIKFGVACLAFPEPIVSDICGYLLITAGLIQRRMKNSALYVEDVNRSFPLLLKELREIRQQL
jgi:hypothetical protein